MLFDLAFPCYLTKNSGKKCLSGKVICFFFPAYRSFPVVGIQGEVEGASNLVSKCLIKDWLGKLLYPLYLEVTEICVASHREGRTRGGEE
jgi:hypothetical protein